MTLSLLPADVIRYLSDLYLSPLDLSCFRKTCRKYYSLVSPKPICVSSLYSTPSLLQYFCHHDPATIAHLDWEKAITCGNIHSLWLIDQLKGDRNVVLTNDDILLAAKHNHFDLLRWYYSVKPCRFQPLALKEFIRHNNALAVRWLLLVETCYYQDSAIFACEQGALDCLRVLVDAGATIFSECSIQAVRNKHFPILTYLAQIGKLYHREGGYYQVPVRTNPVYTPAPLPPHLHLPGHTQGEGDGEGEEEEEGEEHEGGLIVTNITINQHGEMTVHDHQHFVFNQPVIETVEIPPTIAPLLNSPTATSRTLKSYASLFLRETILDPDFQYHKSKIYSLRSYNISDPMCQQILNQIGFNLPSPSPYSIDLSSKEKGKEGKEKLREYLKVLEMAIFNCKKLTVTQPPSHEYYQYLENYLTSYHKVVKYIWTKLTELYDDKFTYAKRKYMMDRLYGNEIRKMV